MLLLSLNFFQTRYVKTRVALESLAQRFLISLTRRGSHVEALATSNTSNWIEDRWIECQKRYFGDKLPRTVNDRRSLTVSQNITKDYKKIKHVKLNFYLFPMSSRYSKYLISLSGWRVNFRHWFRSRQPAEVARGDIALSKNMHSWKLRDDLEL